MIRNNLNRVFLLDAFGALLTSVLLFGVLAPFQPYIGMPLNVLFLLAAIGLCLFLFSLCCVRFIKQNKKPFLALLIIFNSAYSALSIWLVYLHFEKLSTLGLLYFFLELLVIGLLVFIELKTYCTHNSI